MTCRRARALRGAAARAWRHAAFLGRASRRGSPQRFRVLRYDQRGAGAFGKSAAGIHQRHAGCGFRGAGRRASASSRPIISSPSPRPRPRRCAFWKSIPIRSARWCCAIRRRASIQAAPPCSTSAPHSPCARACAPRCRPRSRSPTRHSRRTGRLRGLSRALSGQRSGRLRSWLSRLARTNMLHMLPQIRCPAMVVAGRHDTVRPHAGTAELAKKIPGARFELIESRPLHADARRRSRSLRCSKIFCRNKAPARKQP